MIHPVAVLGSVGSRANLLILFQAIGRVLYSRSDSLSPLQGIAFAYPPPGGRDSDDSAPFQRLRAPAGIMWRPLDAGGARR